MIDIEWYLIISIWCYSFSCMNNEQCCLYRFVCLSLSLSRRRRIKTKTHAHGSWFNLLTVREKEGRQCQRLLSFQMMLFDIDLFIWSNERRRNDGLISKANIARCSNRREAILSPCRDERALTVISTVDGHSRVCGNELDFYSRERNHAIKCLRRGEKSIVHSSSLQNDPEGVNEAKNVKSKDGEEQVD